MSPRFGTDGLRGIAGEDLTVELALALGRAVALELRPTGVVLGLDTRESSPMLASGFGAGSVSEGIAVDYLGTAPTPAVAWVCEHLGLTGAVVTASHNSFEHNGIKIISAAGTKLTDDVEASIQRQLDRILAGQAPQFGREPAPINHVEHLLGRYEDHLVASVADVDLRGLRVLLDCGNGAGSFVGPQVFERCGIVVEVLHAEPNGRNINKDAGSTAMGALSTRIRSGPFDAGFGLDGDADRVLAVDAGGVVIDGDQLIALLALDRSRRGRLPHNAVVASMWSNLGLHIGMKAAGIDVIVTEIGDKYILQALDAGGFVLGGEQSGHIILRDLATTGDGLLTALQTLAVMVRTGDDLASLAAGSMTRLPQVMENVPVSSPPAEVAATFADKVEAENRHLAPGGRLVLRPSGTESVVRVMAEATDPEVASNLVKSYGAMVAAAGKLGRNAPL